jgi:hypothetical protein
VVTKDRLLCSQRHKDSEQSWGIVVMLELNYGFLSSLGMPLFELAHYCLFTALVSQCFNTTNKSKVLDEKSDANNRQGAAI